MPGRGPTRTERQAVLKADPNAQLELLDVADLDARIDLLRHQRATLPEATEAADLSRLEADLDHQLLDARVAVDDLTAEQGKADADVEQVKARRERDRQRIDAGQVTNPKDLQRMQQELVSLERRITSLEDTEIEIMERLEEAQGELDAVGERLAATRDRLTVTTATRDEKTAGIDAELRSAMAERGTAVARLPEALMVLYERIRGQRGVGAAALRARRCGGCQLTLNASQMAEFARAPDDEVLRCEECSRILVRTPESGL